MSHICLFLAVKIGIVLSGCKLNRRLRTHSVYFNAVTQLQLLRCYAVCVFSCEYVRNFLQKVLYFSRYSPFRRITFLCTITVTMRYLYSAPYTIGQRR